MTHPGQPDYGEFTLKTSLNDDLKMIRKATEMAHKNPTKPGHYWQRALVKAETPQGPIELIKMYHVDLKAGLVEITETIAGKETARRTRTLDELG
ncbi:MAG: hypothetical protein HYY18_03480 [Planctomycetes bacterium]|nr:hypothetical protein [Planctomycetota bacterium]